MFSSFVLITHLLCATIFIGIVAFEVLILEGIRPMLSESAMQNVEKGIHTRGKKIMPYVVTLLFITGIYMGFNYMQGMNWQPFESAFGLMLSAKILLALSVLVHFILAMKHSICGTMSSKRFKYTHLSVFTHMVLIVFLAKGMFLWH